MLEWGTSVTMAMKAFCRAVFFISLSAAAQVPVDVDLTAKANMVWRVDDPHEDLRPGLGVSCRVRFDASPAEKGEMTILHKGQSNVPGAYILRVDGPKEGVKFSFFVNVDGCSEPRVSVPVIPKAGEWHDVAAGWDGTNIWISVDGRKALRPRASVRQGVYPVTGMSRLGPMTGTVRDLKVDAPPLPVPADTTIRPGFRIACEATFLKEPYGETTIVCKKDEYWLRYDRKRGQSVGAFKFFVMLGGCWEPRALRTMPVEPGRAYRLCGGWSGLETVLDVDDRHGEPVKRRALCRAAGGRLEFGPKDVVAVSGFRIRNEKKALVTFGMIRTRELMPRVGETATLVGSLFNAGYATGACTLTAKGRAGVKVTPVTTEIPNLGEGAEIPLEWMVDPGTNGFAHVDFEVREGTGKILCRQMKRIVFMPKEDPDCSAKAWNPPVLPTRTYYVDAEAGDDARDGLSPATAWRTFARAKELVLGPGERLLLKRGCVFREELNLKTAAGAAENWAEIGAYGEGMRPQIRRSRHLNDCCVFVADAAYLAVRDLIVCDAGAGVMVSCPSPKSGHILVERCLAHHVEGTYRHNSHGIPEWWDEPGPACGARGYGLAVIGRNANHVVMRDCESYQCSSGFNVRGTEAFVNRIFCHDNYAHNTSPHPFDCASRSWITDCVFDASGWHAAAGTMGVMLAHNDGLVMRGCHFLNQPDSGSPDQGGIDFEAQGENCLIDRCTFRNNAGAAIEVLGLQSPQTRNVHIRGCRFDRNNWAYKNGPAEIQVWGGPGSPTEVCCSNGRIEGNGYVLVPGVTFYVNNTCTTNDWILANNRRFDFVEELDQAFPYPDPPSVAVCGEVWTDVPEAVLSAKIDDRKAVVAWEQIEGPAGVAFATGGRACTKATFPGVGDYRVNVRADNGTLWRTAHTAVHVLPAGTRTYHAWNFAKNLDDEGWRVENAGTGYRFISGKTAFWDSESFPVHLVCGDYYVVAVKASGAVALVTPDDRDLGVEFNATRANAVRIKMQNHTTSGAMRLWWQTDAEPSWDAKRSVAFDVVPNDTDDRVYTVSMPKIGGVKQLKLAFSADGAPVTGTVRIDYIWAGRLFEEKK